MVCNYRREYEYDTDSFVYWGAEDGFDTRSPLRLPSHYAMQVALGDLNGDGRKEIVFAGGNRIYIYWNDDGRFRPDNRTILEAEGNSTMFCVGAIRVAIADVDGDGRNELLVAMRDGVEIRAQDDLTRSSAPALAVLRLGGGGRSRRRRPPRPRRLQLPGRPDLRNRVRRLLERPGRVLADRVTWLPTTGAVGCTAGDLDGDGRPEIVFNNTMRGWSQFNPDFPLYVYLGSERARVQCRSPAGVCRRGAGRTPTWSPIFDLDGYPDLAFVSPEGLRIFHGGPDGLRPDRYTVVRSQGQPFGYVLVADLNRDGWLDLLAVPWTYDTKPETMAKSSVIFWGGPDGFSAERATGVPTWCAGNGHLADVNNDGWLDFIYGDHRGYLGVYLGGPDGFSPERMWKIPLKGTDVATVASINSADLNGDGWLDLIVAVLGHYRRVQSGFFLLYGGPDGFSQERIIFHPTDASSVLIA